MSDSRRDRGFFARLFGQRPPRPTRRPKLLILVEGSHDVSFLTRMALPYGGLEFTARGGGRPGTRGGREARHAAVSATVFRWAGSARSANRSGVKQAPATRLGLNHIERCTSCKRWATPRERAKGCSSAAPHAPQHAVS